MIRTENGIFFLETENTSYIFRIDEKGHAEHISYTGRIFPSSEDIAAIAGPRDIKIGDGTYADEENPAYLPSNILYEYSAPGKGDTRESALIAEYGNGLITLDLVYRSHRIYKGKDLTDSPYALSSDHTETLELKLSDTIEPIEVTLFYTVYPEEDVILRSAEVRNSMAEPLVIRTVSSMQLDTDDDLWDLISFDGAWARERHENRRRIIGTEHIASRIGFTSSEHSSLFFVARPDADDSSGTVMGFNMIYSGNHLERIEKSPFSKCRILSSINPAGSAWVLENGESFRTPEAIMTLSDEGLDGASWNFHRFLSRYISRGYWQEKERPILLNSWEAAYFDITEEKLLRFAEKAAEAGIELFVMDDGWFGRRTDDTRGLGDWFENRDRLPDGIEGLCAKIHALGLKFGLWVEPEMISIDSALYENHPEWVIRIPGRTPSPGRHQYILDMSREDVIDYLFDSLSKVFSKNVDYVKWDANRNMSDYYSSNLELRHQGELFHRYIQGLYRLMSKLKAAFPEILFEFCASGGNRFDPGMLSFMNQGWTSDNTDIRSRIDIQQGTLRGFPPSAICCHVSASPNHQSLRRSGLDDRFGPAAFGVLGYELNILKLDQDEMDAIKKQISFYKAHRHTFQFGRFRHLPSFDKDCIFWSIEGDDEIIVMEYQDRNGVNIGRHHRLIIPFADENKSYRIERREKYISPEDLGELDESYSKVQHKPFSITVSGSVLKKAGIALPNTFMGRGFDENTRLMLDNSSDLFVITPID